ncbi:MAG: hypothetical protein ACI4IQ_07040 [Eubacterium sp.]
MKINKCVDAFIERLKASPCFEDIKILGAYPCSVKPTQLTKTVIAVGLCDIDMSSSGLGEDSRAGCYSVFADIFLPWKADNAVMSDIFKNICAAVYDLNIIGIKAQRITVDNTTGSYVLKSVFTFNDEIDFGGDGDE